MLNLRDLNIKKDENVILKNVNLKIENGDVVCILAQNGVGKSTLLKSIMGFNNIYDISGEIEYNGLDISNLSINQRSNLGIYLSMQDPVEITGIKQIDLYRTIFQDRYNTSNTIELYKKLDGILKQVEFNEDFLQRNVNEGFSGGEKKKNEISQMLLLDPELIMLDEIDSGLDFDTRTLIANIIQEQIKKNKTIIFISHQPEMIKSLQPNKVVLLGDNRILKVGDYQFAEEILSKGYKKVLKEFGVVEKTKMMGSCIGGHFNEK